MLNFFLSIPGKSKVLISFNWWHAHKVTNKYRCLILKYMQMSKVMDYNAVALTDMIFNVFI